MTKKEKLGVLGKGALIGGAIGVLAITLMERKFNPKVAVWGLALGGIVGMTLVHNHYRFPKDET